MARVVLTHCLRTSWDSAVVCVPSSDSVWHCQHVTPIYLCHTCLCVPESRQARADGYECAVRAEEDYLRTFWFW